MIKSTPIAEEQKNNWWALVSVLTIGLYVRMILARLISISSDEFSKPVRFAFIVNRIFCSLSNVLLFGCFTLKVEALFSIAPNIVAVQQRTPERFGVSAGYLAR